MPPLLPLLFTLCVIAVLVWVVYQLITTMPGWGVQTVKMLLIAGLVLVLIFVLAAVFGVEILGGLRLK